MNRRVLLSLIAPSILVLAVGLRAADPPAIERLRLAAFDEFQRLHPRPFVDADVRIVDIDDDSLERLGQWPWPRPLIASLVDRLGEFGAAVVAFDVVFAEPDRTSPNRLLPLWADAGRDPEIARLAASLPDHDAVLAKSIAATSTVLGAILTNEQTPRRPEVKWGVAVAGDDPRPFLHSFTGAVANLTPLEDAAAGIGSLNSATDRDGTNRRVPLLVWLRGGTGAADEIYPSLALEALRVAQGASTYVLRASGASGALAFGEHTGLSQVRVGQFSVPTDARGRLWLYDTGYVARRFIPAWKVLAPDFDGSAVLGKIVLVGTSAAGLKDIRSTPLNQYAAGVELHAQAVEQILAGAFLERPDWLTGAEIAALVVFGALLTLLLPRWGAVWCAVVAGCGIAGALEVSWLAFTRVGWLIDPIYPALAVLLLYLTQSFVLFLKTESERRQVRGAFSRYMSPALVEKLARDPSHLRLGGETRDMTLMFSDIRGFTAISEKLDAENLTRFINRFLTPMTDLILARGGTIDKYMGDAIMAFWNAPLDDKDHAVNAARAALDMIAALEKFNARWGADGAPQTGTHIAIAIGIGLNSGRCCVGNMGSEQRFDYSVLGDTVNLASRLEGQSKNYGVPIVIGEGTRERLPGFACLELDLIAVKGKAQAVHIFALLGDEAVAAEPWFQAAAAAQTAMLAAYRGRAWNRAGELVAEVRRAGGGRLDGLCDLYAERIHDFAAAPPPADWDGVYRASEK